MEAEGKIAGKNIFHSYLEQWGYREREGEGEGDSIVISIH